jgi:hypothetical protein
MRRNRSQRILVRAVLLLLLFAVTVLSTLAKDAKYLPKSNPLRHFAQSTKMESLHHPLDSDPSSTPSVSGVVPPQPRFLARLLVQSQGPALYESPLAVFFQRRAPPSLLA